MAAVQCTRCTAERKGFRRELDTWRHRLIHCVGLESILEGIYGPLLLRDLHLFNDCEPEEVDDWSPESSRSFCSFCNLSLDKLTDQAPAATSPLSSPSDYSPCQTSTISESNQSAHKFLQAVFHKKDVTLDCDSNIPLVAQELMKKMIRQFAVEYASKCLLRTGTNGTNGVTSPSSPVSETSDGPLDLTVSRAVEEIQSEPDGVLDLSNRNSSSSSTLSSSSQKATGFRLPLVTEEQGGVGQRGTKTSALDAVLHSLCPAHRSLLYQILKLAQQENLLLFLNRKPVDSTESLCSHCSANSQEHITCHSVLFVECKAHNRSICCPSADCNHRSHCNLSYHPVDSNSSCSIQQRPFKDSNIDDQRGPNCGCVESCRLDTCSPLCSKRLHCNACQNLAAGCINNTVSSFKSCPMFSQTSLCPSSSRLCSVCYEKTSSGSCCSQHAYSTQVGNIGDEDHFTTQNRGLSPSPPRLSPIPSDIGKKPNEKPPSLFHHRHGEETDLGNKNRLVSSNHATAGVDTENKLPCKMPDTKMEQNTNGTLLQDVMSRFSQKLDNITPVENDPTLVSTAIYVSEKEQQFPSTSQNLPFHADSHLTEIITTVLHTGNASDYNLSELFTRHDDREPKSPNTRARCRQKIQIAIATPTDNASARRHTLEIKRKLAMLDPSYKRRKVPQAKKARLKDGGSSITASGTSTDPNITKEMSKKEAQVVLEPAEDMITEVILSTLSAESQREGDQEKVEAVVVTEELLVNGEQGGLSHKHNNVANVQHTSEQQKTTRKRGPKGDYVELEMAACSAKTAPGPCKEGCTGNSVSTNGSHGASPLGQNSGTENIPEKASLSTVKDGCRYQSNQSIEKRRSMRNIVPPQRFNSYVTWHAPILNVFNKDGDTDDTQSECEPAGKLAFQITQREPSNTEPKDQTHSFVPTMVTKDESSDEHRKKIGTNGSDSGTHRRLRSTTTKLQESEFSQSPLNNGTKIQPAYPASFPAPQGEYISPIKLMFVSQVKDKEGVKYSLKSARSGFSTAEVSFDPCEESSWSGMPQKHKNRRKEGAVSLVKPVLTSLKYVGSSTLPSSSPPKSASLSTKPLKSTSSKSATSHSKSASPLASSSRKSACSPAKSTSPSSKSASSSKKSISSPSESASPLASSSRKSTWSPAKCTSPSPKSASSSKSISSPAKSASSPRSVSLSPKNSSRRSSISTPTKRLSEPESHRSPGDLPCETTPPKRRPGRPKKLGPQPEQKVKRPIGRPPKQKTEGAVGESKSLNGNGIPEQNDDSIVKNLKITVLYGRSRKNKRVVSEGCNLISTNFGGDCHAVEVRRNLATLLHSSSQIKTALEELNFVGPAKEFASQSGSNIKCQKKAKAAPMRKPGRPAKVKISGISVTVKTASPWQRKIMMNKDTTPHSSETQLSKKSLLPDFKSSGEPCTISYQTTTRSNQTKEVMETTTNNRSELPSQPIAVRHSIRDRKPSVHFLHAVATSSSRSYSCSSALLRRSKKLLLNKASSERKQEQLGSVGILGEKRQLCGQKKESVAQDLSRVAKVSLDSIFHPKETVRWWISSAEEETVNQELARRIRVISDTWVSDMANNQGKETSFSKKIDTKGNNSLTRKAKQSSAVQTLFECSPNKPRSCSMQQICSWFMQTTETQSLAIVKKASSRNPYEVMHFSRSAIKQSIGYSPQAERLRKHMKKFAKTVPKSPLQHRQAQMRLRKKNACKVRRHLFVSRFSVRRRNHRVMWWRCTLSGRFWATLIRARTRFLTRKQRESRQKKQKLKINNRGHKGYSNWPLATGLKSNRKALHRSAKAPFSNCVSNFPSTPGNQTQEHGDEQKEQNLCSKAWSPETLKECRVFLRKINSPSNKLTGEWDSCTVTLDDGLRSTCLFAGEKRELEGVVKAVKRKRSMNKKTAARVPSSPGPKSAHNQNVAEVERQRRKHKHPGVVSPELPQEPPAKMLRQSRMRGLSGPRWRDFVFDN
ncbi:uncharacterized protein [Nothobranchius furzeri]